MNLNFDAFETDLRIFVGRVSTNLLGKYFYFKFKCNWDHEKGGMLVNVPYSSTCLRRNNWISTCENISVPPGHEVVIPTTF
jgi:hypothetical protein